MKRNSRKAGISLVALVITIIVLIILTGAVIVTFMEGGIIDRAKESVFKNDMRTYQEILALKRAENQMEIALGEKEDVEINASTLEEIQAIIPEYKEEYEGIVVITDGELSIGERVSGEELSSSEELYFTWLSDLGIGLSRLPKNALASYAKVGDYVKYTPYEGETFVEKSYELLGTESGYFSDRNYNNKYDEGEETNQTIERQDINWRVLKNDGRKITLISETPTAWIGLGGAKGFLNGPEILDEIHSDLYSSSKASEVRNLKIEDVNEIMGIVVGEDVKPYYTDLEFEKVEMEAGATFGEAIDNESYDVSKLSMPDDNYRNYGLDYSYTGSTYKTAENEIAYKLIFKNVTDSAYASNYWLSSSCVRAYLGEDYVLFRMRQVYSGYMESSHMCNASGVDGSDINSGRPIVILNSDVEVANPTAGGDTVDNAWELK